MSRSPLTPRRVEAGFWLLLCGGLGLGIALETNWGRQWHQPLADTAPAAEEFKVPQLAPPFHLSPADSFLESSMRPIFLSTRRPAPAAPPPDAPKPSMKKDQFVLTGTTILPEGKFAFLLEKAGNKMRVVQEGKEINGIVVKRIEPTKVVLTQNDDQETLDLKTAKAPAGAAPAANAVSTPPTPSAPLGRRLPRPAAPSAGDAGAPEPTQEP